jgi:hypothetical protein
MIETARNTKAAILNDLRGIVLLLEVLRCEDTHGAQERTFR